MGRASSIIKKSPVFSACSRAEIVDVLVPSAKEFRFKRNQYIQIQGCELPGVYLIVEGRVKLISYSGNKELIQEILGPGEILGFESIISGLPNPNEAIAMKPCRAYLLPKREFLFLLEHNDAFLINLLDELCHKLAVSQKRVVEVGYQPVRQRVISALIYLSDINQGENADSFNGNRLDISQIAAVRRETATRIIKELEREGLIEIDNEIIRIIKRKALMQSRDLYT